MIYHQTDLTTLYLGDAREILPQVEKESVDLVVSDPPYGVSWRSNTRSERFEKITGDESSEQAGKLLADVAEGLVRATRRSRHIYTFGIPLLHPLVSTTAELIWDKGRLGSGDLTSSWSVSHELIFFHVRAADKCNAERGTGKLSARLRRGSVLSVPRPSAKQVSRHPTEKPVDLLRQLIESSSSLGETVLDPFVGSGSTLVAALLEGRKGIGIEIEERYADEAARRLVRAESVLEQLGRP